MAGQALSFGQHDIFFRVGRAKAGPANHAVAQRIEHSAHARKIAHTKIRDVPAEHHLANDLRKIPVFLPSCAIPARERGQAKARLADLSFRPFEGGVDFTAFHLRSSIWPYN